MRDVLIDRMLSTTLQEAPQSPDNITMFVETCRAGPIGELLFNVEGLSKVEKAYRRMCDENLFRVDMSQEMFEELMSYFLGQLLVQEQGGEWFGYKGSMYTIKPVLIRFPDKNKSLDISMFCKDLFCKKVAGAREGLALIAFYRKARKLAVI